jgi:uncharacterized protein YkwD
MCAAAERPTLQGMAAVRIAALAAALALAAAFAGTAAAAVSLSPLEQSILADINVVRSEHGLAALKMNTRLTVAARAHTRQMALDGYFAHESADGSSFWRRVQGFYRSAPWSVWSVGENLLWSSPDVTAPQALQLWLASPEHRKNLLDPRWREIGVAAVHTAHAPGVYAGREVTIVTTDFGVRR